MPTTEQTSSTHAVKRSVNIANRLSAVAARVPDQIATVQVAGRSGDANEERLSYRTATFAQLEDESNRIAAGLLRMGVSPGERLVLLVPYSHEFVALTFALFKAGVVSVLIDPGMGRKNMVRCLADARPDGFVAVPAAHLVRSVLRHRFPQAKHLVTVGRRWFWGGETLARLQKTPLEGFAPVRTAPEDDAAVIFTTGSTGPPKGVLYKHGNFDHQVREIAERYQIEPGGVDLACFPLFGLFNGGMGTTTVIPDMDPTRPADADPEKLMRMMEDWQVTQSFASPALWTAVMRYCVDRDAKLPSSLTRLYSAGAAVPARVMRAACQVTAGRAELHTPYGATEALPVASISSPEVMDETAQATASGAGTCVGTRFPGIEWRVIAIDDGPLPDIECVTPLQRGQIGELMVKGPVVTQRYVTRSEANALHKVQDGDAFWHRMGDVGYLDASDRFWICGRKSHRVTTSHDVMFTLPCEAIFNQHPAIYRSALVGVGAPGSQTPVVVCEPWPETWPKSTDERRTLLDELASLGAASELTERVVPGNILLRKALPVDIRHNAKIFREKLVPWCAKRCVTFRSGSERPR